MAAAVHTTFGNLVCLLSLSYVGVGRMRFAGRGLTRILFPFYSILFSLRLHLSHCYIIFLVTLLYYIFLIGAAQTVCLGFYYGRTHWAALTKNM